jgi:hypothetical protein
MRMQNLPEPAINEKSGSGRTNEPGGGVVGMAPPIFCPPENCPKRYYLFAQMVNLVDIYSR